MKMKFCIVFFHITIAHLAIHSVKCVVDNGFNGSAIRLNEMDLRQLLKVALHNKNSHDEVTEAFYQKYGHLQVDICSVSSGNQYFSITDTVLSIDHIIIYDFLKTFGNRIERLAISYDAIPSYSYKEISKQVNDYCSKTLIEFHAKHCPNNPFEYLEKPFKAVESATFEDLKMQNQSIMDVDKLFPAMKRLNLTNVDASVFDHHYPNLIKVISDVATFKSFKDVIEKNPQIESVRVSTTSVEFLRLINDTLPRLTSLEFDIPRNLKSWLHIVQLGNITHALIKDTEDNYRSGKLMFKELKELELQIDGSVKDKWIEFIGENDELKRLKISSGYFQDSALLRLSNKLNHLVEGSIHLDVLVDFKHLEQFLTNKSQLNRITLKPYPNGSESYFDRLAQRFDGDWTVTPLDDDYCCLSLTKSDYLSTFEALSDNLEALNMDEMNSKENSNLVNNTNKENSTFENGASHVMSTTLTLMQLVVIGHSFIF